MCIRDSIIAAADGPTSIFVANSLGSKYMGAIMVAAYSYMALVPIIQPLSLIHIFHSSADIVGLLPTIGAAAQINVARITVEVRQGIVTVTRYQNGIGQRCV